VVLSITELTILEIVLVQREGKVWPVLVEEQANFRDRAVSSICRELDEGPEIFVPLGKFERSRNLLDRDYRIDKLVN
jgi:hypothetical protein